MRRPLAGRLDVDASAVLCIYSNVGPAGDQAAAMWFMS